MFVSGKNLFRKKNPITSMVFHLEQVAEAGALESVLKPRVWSAQWSSISVCGRVNRGAFLEKS